MLPLIERKDDALPVGAILGAARSDMLKKVSASTFSGYAFAAIDVRLSDSVFQLLVRTLASKTTPTKRSMVILTLNPERIVAAARIELKRMKKETSDAKERSALPRSVEAAVQALMDAEQPNAVRAKQDAAPKGGVRKPKRRRPFKRPSVSPAMRKGVRGDKGRNSKGGKVLRAKSGKAKRK